MLNKARYDGANNFCTVCYINVVVALCVRRIMLYCRVHRMQSGFNGISKFTADQAGIIRTMLTLSTSTN